MAQFIQPSQLPEVQGTIGQQQIVQSNKPTLDKLTTPLIGFAGEVGQEYSKNKGESLVTETLEDIDKARAVAEQGNFVAGDTVPPSVKLDQKEWNMIAGAVQAGTMSRENARLLASSRLRSRIAEEPLFAKQIRQSASGVLGFNIESEGAQQYFASFATNADIASAQASLEDKERTKKMNEARRGFEVGLFESVESGYKLIVASDVSKRRMELAEQQLTMNGMTSQEFASQFVQEEQVTAWGQTLGEIKAFEIENGKPIDAVAFNRILDERKQDAVSRFNASWRKGKAPINTPEYDRAVANVTKEYDAMKEYAEAYGIDKLTSVQIERNIQARALYGDKFFPQMKFIVQEFGQQVASDYIRLAGLNDVQRKRMFADNPRLEEAYNLLGLDSGAFNKMLADVGSRLIKGEPLVDQDPAVVDGVASLLHSSENQDTKKAAVQGLFEGGLQWKAISLLAKGSPRIEPQENRDTYKTQYEESLAPAIAQLSSEVILDPSLVIDVDDKGFITVRRDDAAVGIEPTVDPHGGLVENPQEVQRRMQNFRRAKQTADKINQFATGHQHGWSRVVGETAEQYRAKVEKLTKDGVANATKQRQTNQSNQVEFIGGLIEDGDLKAAERQYKLLQENFPSAYTMSWEDTLKAIMEE